MYITEKKQTDRRETRGRTKYQDELAYTQSNSGQITKNSPVKKELQRTCQTNPEIGSKLYQIVSVAV